MLHYPKLKEFNRIKDGKDSPDERLIRTTNFYFKQIVTTNEIFMKTMDRMFSLRSEYEEITLAE